LERAQKFAGTIWPAVVRAKEEGPRGGSDPRRMNRGEDTCS